MSLPSDFWLLELTDWHYDDIVSCVVRAPSEAVARETAARHMCSEGERVRLVAAYGSPEASTCVRIPADAPPEVVHTYRRHG